MSPLECAETLIFMGLAKIITEDSFDEDGPLAKFRDEFASRAEDVANAVDVPENDGEQAVVDMARAALQFIDDSRVAEDLVAAAAVLDAQPVPTQDRMIEPAAQSGVEGRFALLRALADEVRASGRPMIADELEAIAALNAAPPAAVPCRDDGRCQYAIDHGAEGMGHCSPKCVMPRPAAPLSEGLTKRIVERLMAPNPGGTVFGPDMAASIARRIADLLPTSPSPQPTDEATGTGGVK
jgi:hypothetical protein